MGETLPSVFVNTKSNTSDLLTKVLSNGKLTRERIVRLAFGTSLIEFWLSEDLSFQKSEMIRVPNDRFLTITNTAIFLFFIRRQAHDGSIFESVHIT